MRECQPFDHEVRTHKSRASNSWNLPARKLQRAFQHAYPALWHSDLHHDAEALQLPLRRPAPLWKRQLDPGKTQRGDEAAGSFGLHG